MKKLIYTLLLLLVTFPAMAQSLFEQYERFLTEPRTYVCYRPDGKLKIDGKLNESSWKKAAPTAPFVDISGEGFPTPKYEGSPDKPGGLSIQLCKSEKKEFYIRYSS